MIKYFRKIRYDLMEKNKTGKYLKYAVGEIILVMIGILLALQVNNWNERRKDYEKSKNNLTEILKDLQSDSLAFNRTIERVNKYIKIEEWALNKLDLKASQLDSISMSFGGRYFVLSINNRTFQKTLNDGSSKLVGFELLSDSINNYYTVLKNNLESHINWDIREVTQRQEYMHDLDGIIELSNYRLKNGSDGLYKQKFSIKQDSLELIKLTLNFANSIQYRNHVKKNYIRHLRIRDVFLKGREECINLMSNIEGELELVKK